MSEVAVSVDIEARFVHGRRADMSYLTRYEVTNLLKKAEAQLKRSQEVQRQLQQMLLRLTAGDERIKEPTKRKPPK